MPAGRQREAKQAAAAAAAAAAEAPELGRVYGVTIDDPGSALCKAWVQDISASPSKLALRSARDRLPATIRERRLLRHLRESGGADDSGRSPRDYEYYVHYKDFDTRHDEWVTFDRLDMVTGPLVSKRAQRDAEIQEQFRKEQLLQAQQERMRRLNGGAGAGGGGGSTGAAASAAVSFSTDMGFSQGGGCGGALSQSQSTPLTLYAKNIRRVVIGTGEGGHGASVDAWYYSPYDNECIDDATESVHLCGFCLKPFKSRKTLERLHLPCDFSRPPGREVYREAPREAQPDEDIEASPALVLYEVNGAGLHSKAYCQNLCLLAKLFLEHKSVTHATDGFVFYVLCEEDAAGKAHVAGFFSKEKHSEQNHNLACLVVLPQYQKKSYGCLLVSISYELSRRQGNFLAAPEKPLSDLAQLVYRRYWGDTVLRAMVVLRDQGRQCSINELNKMTGIGILDIADSLDQIIIDQIVDEETIVAPRPKSQLEWTSPSPPKRRVLKKKKIVATIKSAASYRYYNSRARICDPARLKL